MGFLFFKRKYYERFRKVSHLIMFFGFDFDSEYSTLIHMLYNRGGQLVDREPHVALVIVKCGSRLIY